MRPGNSNRNWPSIPPTQTLPTNSPKSIAKPATTTKARLLFASALQYYPDFEEANVGLGRTLIAIGKPEESISYFEKAAKLNPRDEVLYYQLSLAYKALGKPEEQRSALDRFQQIKAETAANPNIMKSPNDVTKQEAQ